jgi:hypothetical protein
LINNETTDQGKKSSAREISTSYKIRDEGLVHYVDLGAVWKQLLQCLELLVDLIPSPLQTPQLKISGMKC